MPENYRGYELNVPNDPKWGTRENTFHKQIIDKVLDNPIDSLKNSVYVGINGNDSTATGSIAKPFATIAAALASITDNSVNNPYVIRMAGGVFTESQTLNVGEGIDILGSGDSTIIKTTNDDVNLFNMANQSDLYDLTIYGPTNAKTISITDAGVIVTLKGLKLVNNAQPIYINTEDGTVTIDTLALRGNDIEFEHGIEVLSGTCFIYGCAAIGVHGTNMVYTSGNNSKLYAWDINCESTTLTTMANVNELSESNLTTCRANINGTAIYVNNAFIGLNQIFMFQPNIGIDVSPNGVSGLLLSGVRIIESITLDMRVQTTNVRLGGLNNFMRDSKIEFTNGIPNIDYYLTHFSHDEGDESFIIKSELAVGSPDRPSESCFGEGDSYTRGMLVYTYDPTNGFTDVTTIAKSYSSSTFGFSDIVTDSAIYSSSDIMINDDYVKFFGLKAKISASGVIGTGSVVSEYWNGSAWVEFGIMRTQGNSPYLPIVGNLIDIEPGSYQLRSSANIDLAWEKNDPIYSGTDRYWTRIRITSDITTSPLYEQLKIHSNRTELNGDGWIEYFGKARPIGRLPWSYGMVQAAVSSPGDQDQFLSDTLDVGKIENAFANNVSDRVGFLAPVPFDLDTSTPIKFRWAARYSTNTGNVKWNVRSGFSTESDIIYISQADAPTTHTTQVLTTITETVPTTIGQIMWHSVDIHVHNMNPRTINGVSDILWVSIERDGSADTFTGIAGLVAVSGDYLKWTEGGHQ